MLPVSPWHQWFWRHRSVCLQHVAQTLWILHAISTRLCSFFIEAQRRNPLLQREVWTITWKYTTINPLVSLDNQFLISWSFYLQVFRRSNLLSSHSISIFLICIVEVISRLPQICSHGHDRAERQVKGQKRKVRGRLEKWAYKTMRAFTSN